MQSEIKSDESHLLIRKEKGTTKESCSSVFDKTDWHHIIDPNDYIENASLPFEMLDNMYHIGVFGMSRCGKGNFICKLFQHFYLHKVDPTEIYIFSPSFNTDVTYAPL